MSHLRVPAARTDRREGGRHGRPDTRSSTVPSLPPLPPLPEAGIRPQLVRLAVLPPLTILLGAGAAVFYALSSTGVSPRPALYVVLGGAFAVALAAVAVALVAAGRAARSVGLRVTALRALSARGETELGELTEALRRGDTPPVRRPRGGRPDTSDDFELLAADLARAQDTAVTAVVAVASGNSGATEAVSGVVRGSGSTSVSASGAGTPGSPAQKLEVFLNLARRLQSLVDREMSALDELESEIEDPDLLKSVFHVDHLATRIRRHAESLAVLGGAGSRRQWTDPVAMTEVLRSAIAEVEQYGRVQLVPPVEGTVKGHAVADVVHLLAELVENATVFSAPHTQVLLRASLVTAGLAVEVEDRGLGMPVAEQQRMNALLGDPGRVDVAGVLTDGRIGLYVVSQLARRHGIDVRLQSNIYGGVQAVLVLPEVLLGDGSGVQPGEDVGELGSLEGVGESAAGRVDPVSAEGAVGTAGMVGTVSTTGPVALEASARSSAQDGPVPGPVRPVRPAATDSRAGGAAGFAAPYRRAVGSGGLVSPDTQAVRSAGLAAPDAQGVRPAGSAVPGSPAANLAEFAGAEPWAGGPVRSAAEEPTAPTVPGEARLLGLVGAAAPGPTTGAVPGSTPPPLPTRGRHRHRHVPGQGAEPEAGARRFTAPESAPAETGAPERTAPEVSAPTFMASESMRPEPTAPEVTPSGPEHRTETGIPSDPGPRSAFGPEFLAAAGNATVPPARSAPSLRPRTGSARGAVDRPGLPRRRAQEHLAPQLRDAPARHEPSSRTEADSPGTSFTGHDPGLMAAFQRGFAKAQDQAQDQAQAQVQDQAQAQVRVQDQAQDQIDLPVHAEAPIHAEAPVQALVQADVQDQLQVQPPAQPQPQPQSPESLGPAHRGGPAGPPVRPHLGGPDPEPPQPHPHDPQPHPHPQPHPTSQEHPDPQAHPQSHPQTHPPSHPHSHPEEPTHHGE